MKDHNKKVALKEIRETLASVLAIELTDEQRALGYTDKDVRQKDFWDRKHAARLYRAHVAG